MKKVIHIAVFAFIAITLFSCKEDPPMPPDPIQATYDPTPYVLSYPSGVPDPVLPADNPLTVKGVELGRRLFYDPILSQTNSISCASCHKQEFAFSDGGVALSLGVNGAVGVRNSMALFNLAWDDDFFNWDGSASSLEMQHVEPVINPLEMAETWENVLAKLSVDSQYPSLFVEAFNETDISRDLATRAIAQFLRSIVSFNSEWDKFNRGEPGVFVSDDALDGRQLFVDFTGADCLHCHDPFVFFDDRQIGFRNNGLDPFCGDDFPDPGLGSTTGNINDNGKFKATSLRNIEVSGPYMHDGRFETLDEVIDFYSDGVNASPCVDNLMEFAFQGGVMLNAQEKVQIKAFLLSLTDQEFLTNPAYSNPF